MQFPFLLVCGAARFCFSVGATAVAAWSAELRRAPENLVAPILVWPDSDEYIGNDARVSITKTSYRAGGHAAACSLAGPQPARACHRFQPVVSRPRLIDSFVYFL